MDNPLAEKSKAPTRKALSRALGRTMRHWDLVLEQAHGDHEGLVETWKFYGAKIGWTLKVAGKKRTVLWLSPREGRFLASLALRDDAVAALRGTNLPTALVAEVEGAKPWPEGRPVRLEVSNLQQVGWIRKLVAIKLHPALPGPTRS